MASPHIEKIINHLWRPVAGEFPSGVYALVDAARDEVIYPKISESGIESACLFRGDKARELAWVAPYLVLLDRDEPFTEWLLVNGWGKSWGVFLESQAPFSKLKRHFESFLTVYDEEGNTLHFRYYDPRVLRVYLPTCNAEELATVFGPVSCYMIEAENASVLQKISGTGGKLRIDKLQIA
jgi:Domain of unknown function (DUF4123)